MNIDNSKLNRFDSANNPKIPSTITIDSPNTSKLTPTSGGNIVNNQVTLYSRELKLGTDVGSDKVVIEEIKKCAAIYRNTLNSLLNKKQKVKYHENESLETIIWNIAEGNKKIQVNKLIHKFNHLLEQHPIIFPDYERELKLNAMTCWLTLKAIFEKHFEYIDDRKAFQSCAFKKNNGIIIENVEPLLNKVIAKLETIKEEYYLATFRIFMDPNLSCSEKNQLTQDFLGYFYPENDPEFDPCNQMCECAKKIMRNMACDFSKLQILLDCLNKMMQVPKTYSNMIIGYNVLKSSCNFYELSLPNTREGLKLMKIDFPLCSARYYSDYIDMCFYLKTIEKEYLGLLEAGYSKNIDKMFAEPEKTNKVKKNKTSRKKKQQSKNQEAATQINEALVVNQGTSKGKEELLLTKDCDVIDKSNPLKENTINSSKLERIETSLVPKEEPKTNIILNEEKLKFVYVEDQDEDKIEQETNILMEIMRQICEQDRKEKVRNQEEKRKQKVLEKSIIETEVENVEIVEKPMVQKLNKTHQELLKMLFSENPPYLTISEAEVECLIKILEGRVVGDGNGSKFKVFWKGSNKQAGMYEVAHGSDRKGYLTSEWAKRAGEAIKVGMDYGLVVIDTQFLSIESFDK